MVNVCYRADTGMSQSCYRCVNEVSGVLMDIKWIIKRCNKNVTVVLNGVFKRCNRGLTKVLHGIFHVFYPY